MHTHVNIFKILW